MINKQPELYAFLSPSRGVSEFYYNDDTTDEDMFILVKIKTVPRKRLTVKFLKLLKNSGYCRFTRTELECAMKLIGYTKYKR